MQGALRQPLSQVFFRIRKFYHFFSIKYYEKCNFIVLKYSNLISMIFNFQTLLAFHWKRIDPIRYLYSSALCTLKII